MAVSRTFKCERLFPLGDYKNIKFYSEMAVDGDDVELYKPHVVYDMLMDDVYQAFFVHAGMLDQLKDAGKDKDAQVEAWNNAMRRPKEE